MLDRPAKAAVNPTAIQSTFTAEAPLEATNTDAVIPSSTPTLEPATATATPAEETNIYNAFLAFDFKGKFVDVPGLLVDSQYYNTINEYKDPNVKLVISQGGLTPGKYKVELLLNNTLDETMEFSVAK